jgi:16S rRNA (cytidine1402-2'-O)-methyltransferase
VSRGQDGPRANEDKGRLYVVSTPIGNMGDFSFRAVEILKSVDVVLAEDTRHSKHLLDRYDISTKLLAYHEHNEAKTTPRLVDRLLEGQSMAIVTDAGTPLLSDPGARLVAAAIQGGIPVVPIPGASALLSALVASGLPAEKFTFFGFLERGGAARRGALAELAALPHTAVLYEAPSRVGGTLADLANAGMGSRRASVAREMTKQFEEVRRGTVTELAAYYNEGEPRGEFVIVLGGAEALTIDEATVRERVLVLRAEGRSAKDTAAIVAKELGVSKNMAYRMTQGSE